MRVRSDQTDVVVQSIAELDDTLDQLEASLTEPSLVALTAGGVGLNIGIGRDDVSVALYLARDGRPMGGWSSTVPKSDRGEDVVFAKDGRRYSFYAEATITPDVARQVARDFVLAPDSLPLSVEWRYEPE